MNSSLKRYRCTQCGHVEEQRTNHYGEVYSAGHFNCCRACPPFRKYPEFGGHTVWECLDSPPHWEVTIANTVSADYFCPPTFGNHAIKEVLAFHATTAPRKFMRVALGTPWVRMT